MTGPRPVLDTGIGSGQGIWEVVTNPILRVGTRGSLEDGRVFYYARSSDSNALPAGWFLQQERGNAQNEDRACVDAEIGDPIITVTFGTKTANANDYANGYVCVVDSIGEGITYQIDAHGAVTSGAAVALRLKDPVYVAFESDTTVTVIKNPWMDVIRSDVTNELSAAAGVSQVAVPVGSTTPQYFWCQTWGVAAVRSQVSGIVQGSPVVRSTLNTSTIAKGSVGYQPGPLPEIIGTVLFDTSQNEFCPMFLRVSQ